MTVPNFARISIDRNKCQTPFACKKCLQACLQSVFSVHAIKVQRGRETNPDEPGTYALASPHRDKCTGCNDCIEICPTDAISISFASMEAQHV